MNQKRLLKVKVFNRIREDQYREAIKNWDYRKGGRPFLGMYIFCKDNRVPRRKGYVVSKGGNKGKYFSHKFYHTKEEVFINEEMRINTRGEVKC